MFDAIKIAFTAVYAVAAALSGALKNRSDQTMDLGGRLSPDTALSATLASMELSEWQFFMPSACEAVEKPLKAIASIMMTRKTLMQKP